MKMMEIFWLILFINFGFVIFGMVGINPFPDTGGFSSPVGYASVLVFFTFMGTLISYSIAGYFFKVQNTMQTAVVSTVGGLYYSCLITMTLGLATLVASFPMVGIFWSVAMVAMIYVGIIGLSQFATGGWSGYK